MVHRPIARIVLAGIAVLALDACSGARSRFPSLAQRPAERAYGTAMPVPGQPAPPAPPTVPQATLAARLVALGDQVREAHATFEGLRPSAERAVRSAEQSTPGAEAWSVAQVRLAELESARSQAMVALADLDRLLVVAAQAAVEGPDADLKAVEAAMANASDLIAAEDATLASLHARLPG